MGIELVRGDRKSLIPIIDRWSWEIALPRRKAARENGDKLSEKPERVKESCIQITRASGKIGKGYGMEKHEYWGKGMVKEIN